MIELSLDPVDLLTDQPARTMLVALTAGDARTHGKGIVRSPKETDPAHGDLTGPDTGSVRTALRKAALPSPNAWIIGPPDVGIG